MDETYQIGDFADLTGRNAIAVNTSALLELVTFAKDDPALDSAADDSEIMQAIEHLDGRLDHWAEVEPQEPDMSGDAPACPECGSKRLSCYIGAWQEGSLTTFVNDDDDAERTVFEGGEIEVWDSLNYAHCGNCDTPIAYDV